MTEWSRDLLVTADGLPEHEVVRLLMAATGRSRTDVLMGFDVDGADQKTFREYVQRRRRNEPLQYIEGSVSFGPVELIVNSSVLVPRPETEYLFEQVTAMVDSPEVIVDLCTGSGNLALALANAFPTAEVYAVDVSEDAAAVARMNAAGNDLSVEVLTGDLFDPLPDSIRGHVDLLVSNPPYLAENELDVVPLDVLEEPHIALVSGSEGDEVLAEIAANAHEWLSPGGQLACEISEYHGEQIAKLFARYDPVVGQDLTGRDRYVFGTLRFG